MGIGPLKSFDNLGLDVSRIFERGGEDPRPDQGLQAVRIGPNLLEVLEKGQADSRVISKILGSRVKCQHQRMNVMNFQLEL